MVVVVLEVVSSDSEPDFKKPRNVSGGARAQFPAANVHSGSPHSSAGTQKSLPAVAGSRPSCTRGASCFALACVAGRRKGGKSK